MEEVKEMTLAKFVLIMNCQLIKEKKKKRQKEKKLIDKEWQLYAVMSKMIGYTLFPESKFVVAKNINKWALSWSWN